jgi:hypothetical protein
MGCGVLVGVVLGGTAAGAGAGAGAGAALPVVVDGLSACGVSEMAMPSPPPPQAVSTSRAADERTRRPCDLPVAFPTNTVRDLSIVGSIHWVWDSGPVYSSHRVFGSGPVSAGRLQRCPAEAELPPCAAMRAQKSWLALKTKVLRRWSYLPAYGTLWLLPTQASRTSKAATRRPSPTRAS